MAYVTIDSAGLELLLSNFPQTLPPISGEDLEERSDSTAIAEVAACWTTITYCTKVIPQWLRSLQVSVLEISTMIHALSTIVLYAIWWNELKTLTQPLRLVNTTLQVDQMIACMCVCSWNRLYEQDGFRPRFSYVQPSLEPRTTRLQPGEDDMKPGQYTWAFDLTDGMKNQRRSTMFNLSTWAHRARVSRASNAGDQRIQARPRRHHYPHRTQICHPPNERGVLVLEWHAPPSPHLRCDHLHVCRSARHGFGTPFSP